MSRHLIPGIQLRKPVFLVASLFLMALVVFTGVSQASTAENLAELRQLAQLAEYIGVDYVAAVQGGQVVNATEYQEMVEFSQILVNKSRKQASTLSSFQAVAKHAYALQQAIQNTQDASTVRELSAKLHSTLLSMMPPSLLPDRLLPKESTKTLFEANCATCHGLTGSGDGVLAAQFDPLPTNFTDKDRALNRSILGLFDAITNGIKTTAMPAFERLTEQQRWSLAFYAGSLAFQSSPQPTSATGTAVSLQRLVHFTPAQIVADLPRARKKEVGWFRANPGLLFSPSFSPLAVTRSRLQAAHQAYQAGKFQDARNLAISAYLDGFELLENSLDARDETLRKSIETNMMNLRQLIIETQKNDEVDALVATILTQLGVADRLLNASRLSSGALFTASLVILLREGLEALLVIIALMTVLIRTQRKDALKYVHLGWITALLAGWATWAAAQSLISISGASREVMEGVAALLAAIVLFYVGIWMHGKTQAVHWQTYIQRHVNESLKSGTLWGLAALAFIAVYREVFETVLFYQSLLTQAATTQYSSVIGGLLLGVVLLGGLSWTLIRSSIKLPIAMFFSVTTYVLLALSFVLMGKAVSALQEAALIGMTSLPVSFEIDWIGVKSTWEGLLAQGSILLVFLVFILVSKKRRQRLIVATQSTEV